MAKKGYVSFLLFFIICFILLYPLFFYKSPFPLWPSFVLKETSDIHILHKRALISLFIDKFEEIKPILKLSKTTNKIQDVLALLPFPFNVILRGVSQVASSREFRSTFAKAYLLLAAQDLSSKITQYSNYNLDFFCHPSFSPFFSDYERSILSTFIDNNSPPFFVPCYSLLEYIDGPEDSAGKIKIHKGFFVLTSSKLLKSEASSPIEELEIS
ncbi:MAG: hypothetical protein QXV83_00615 [Candidatus Anstonellaceae archaeon]